jgi:hypothetical protein
MWRWRWCWGGWQGRRKARTFFLNPFVILVSAAWMIEGLMAVFALGALWLLTRGRHTAAGLLLALGTLTKWTPGILWPVPGLWMLHRRTPWRSQAAFHVAFLATLVAGVAPFWEGVLFAARFHALRPGANLSPHILLYGLAQFSRSDVGWYYHVLSPYVGAITLPLTLGRAYLAQVRRPMPLTTAACPHRHRLPARFQGGQRTLRLSSAAPAAVGGRRTTVGSQEIPVQSLLRSPPGVRDPQRAGPDVPAAGLPAGGATRSFLRLRPGAGAAPRVARRDPGCPGVRVCGADAVRLPPVREGGAT